jgi:hypothetical protein
MSETNQQTLSALSIVVFLLQVKFFFKLDHTYKFISHLERCLILHLTIDWNKTESLGTATQNRPVIPVMNIDYWWYDDWPGKPKCHFVHDCSGIEPRPP